MLVGIDDYDYLPRTTGRSEAAHALADVLGSQPVTAGDPIETVVLPTDPGGGATGNAIEDAVQDALKDCDEFWFYFAGHAATRSNDLWLLASDHDPFSRHATGLGLGELMKQIRDTYPGVPVTFILDCPNSDIIQSITVPPGHIVMTIADAPALAVDWPKGQRELAFTAALVKGLEGAAKDPLGRVTALSLFSYACGVLGDATKHQPLLAGRIVGTRILRQVSGLSLADVNQLPKVFEKRDSEVTVTPDHEWPGIAQLKNGYTLADEVVERGYTFVSRPMGWSADQLDEYVENEIITHEQKEKQLEQLYFQRLRDAGMLEILDKNGKKTPLFWACLGNGRVRLTPLGQHYWQMAKEDKAV